MSIIIIIIVPRVRLGTTDWLLARLAVPRALSASTHYRSKSRGHRPLEHPIHLIVEARSPETSGPSVKSGAPSPSPPIWIVGQC